MSNYKEITFDAREASPQAIADCVRTRGLSYVQNLFDPALMAYCDRAMQMNSRALNDLIGKEINFMPLCFADRYLNGETKTPPAFGTDLKSFGDPLTFSKMDKSWYYEGDRQFKLWFWRNGKTLSNVLLRAVAGTMLPEVYRTYFGGACVSPYEHDALHYQRPDLQKLFYLFHQDGSYFSYRPEDHSGITTWIPLVDCGLDCPGLELYPYKLHEVLPPPKGQPLPYTFLDTEEVLKRFGNKLWAPAMKAGECLIFDNFLVHRTSVTPQMTKERRSADIRVFAANNRPDYVNLYKGWMVDIA